MSGQESLAQTLAEALCPEIGGHREGWAGATTSMTDGTTTFDHGTYGICATCRSRASFVASVVARAGWVSPARVQAEQSRISELQEQLASEQEYAREGWAWVEDFCDRAGVPHVFELCEWIDERRESVAARAVRAGPEPNNALTKESQSRISDAGQGVSRENAP